MNAKQFFEMELPLNVTRSEMSFLIDSLFIAQKKYKQRKQFALANIYGNLFNKIYDIANKYDEYFEK